MTRWWSVVAVGSMTLLAGCGGDPPVVSVTVSVSPASANLKAGATQQFLAEVKGTSDASVVWSVDESGGGSIDATGLYTAPMAAGTFTIRATSAASSGATATATVTVTQDAPVVVTVLPANVNLQGGDTQQFAAIVTGTDSTAVVWSVDEAGGGSVTGDGLYTAPAAQSGAFHVRATSVASPMSSGTATATVTAAPMVTVTVSPDTVTLTGGAQQQFTATVMGSTNTAVSWTATGGVISATGLFTAPSTPGPVTVTATPVADPTKSASATVTVTEPVVVTVSPASATLVPGATATFTATVTGTSNTAVTWTASGGSITPGGVFTAPMTAGNYTVTATSDADPNASATVMITVAPVTVTLAPLTASLIPNGTQQFTATVTGNPNTAVTWTATGGTIDANGLYTAGTSTGVFSVTATSHADPTQSALATVTISDVQVVINPKTVTMQAGSSRQFQVTVTGSTNTAVTWSVPNTLNGTISATGYYTAPMTPGTYSVIATSVADPARSDTATVTVTAAPVVGISITNPTNTVTLKQGATQQYTAQVTGSTNTQVSWSASGGSISATGLFTAPTGATAAGTYTITATSVADPSATATAQLIVPDVTVTVSPATATVFAANATGATPTSQLFTATVTGAQVTTVTWSIVEGSVGGTIGSGGSYAAPATPGTYTVLARSTVDTSKQATATVTVQRPPVVVSITPTSVTLAPGGQTHFTGTAANSDAGVVFSVADGGIGGVVDAFGNYTAPAGSGLSGTDFVVATSAEDPMRSAQATVLVCTAGLACTPAGQPCKTGSTVCSGGAQSCSASSVNMPNGTSCGTGLVCSGGACVSCVAGQACSPLDTCAVGVTSCDTGVSVCVPSAPNPANPPGTACGVSGTGTCQGGACTCPANQVFTLGDCYSCPSFTGTAVRVNSDPSVGADDACCGRNTTAGLGGPCLTIGQGIRNALGSNWTVNVTPNSLGTVSAAEQYPIALERGVRVALSGAYVPGVAGQPIFVAQTDSTTAFVSGGTLGIDRSGTPSGASVGVLARTTSAGQAASVSIQGVTFRGLQTGLRLDGATGQVSSGSFDNISGAAVRCSSDTVPTTASALTMSLSTVGSADRGLEVGRGCVATTSGVVIGAATSGVCPQPRAVDYGCWVEGDGRLTINAGSVLCANHDGVSVRVNPSLPSNASQVALNNLTLRYNGCAGVYAETGRTQLNGVTARNNHFGVWVSSLDSGSDPLLSPINLNPGLTGTRNQLLCNNAQQTGACATGQFATRGFSVFNNSGFPIDADRNYWGESPVSKCSCNSMLASCACAGWAVGQTTPPDGVSAVSAPLGAGAPSISTNDFAVAPSPACP